MASKYPFGNLNNVGDSEFFSSESTVNAVRVAASLYGKRHGRKLKVTVQQAPSDQAGTYFRVERVG